VVIWLKANNANPNYDSASDWTVLEQDSNQHTLVPNDQVAIRICGLTALGGYVAKMNMRQPEVEKRERRLVVLMWRAAT
jgi:hypothetical protein